MKIRQGGVWVDVNAYVRQNNQWTYASFLKNADEFLLVISQTTTNLNLQTAFNNTFGTTAWISSKRKRVVINSGVIVGSLNVVNYALTIPTGLGGSLTIENLGSIQGAGGAANGGTGGNAILANSPVSINNQGSIYAGGGGGGQGGTGGQGAPSTSGGAGGSGGVGQGYNQTLTSGSLGLAGGAGAGTGGTGGAGGNWGASGSAGTAGSNGTLTVGSPGSPGGLSGFYVVNEDNITWINKGNVAGRDI